MNKFVLITTIIFNCISSELAFGQKIIVCDQIGSSVSKGLIAVRKGQKWGFIDTTGKLVHDYKLETTAKPYNTYTIEYKEPVYSENLFDYSKQKGLYRLLNKNLNSLTGYIFEATGEFSEGLCYVEEIKGYRQNNFLQNVPIIESYMINKYGQKVIPLGAYNTSFNSLSIVCKESRIAVFVQGKGYGYLNKKGSLTIAPKYWEASNFSDGLASVLKANEYGEKRWGFIDTTGNVVIDFQYTYKPGNFKSGIAQVKSKDGKYGFINKKGEIIIEPQYTMATDFNEGLASVSKNYDQDCKFVINEKGEEIFELKSEVSTNMGMIYSMNNSSGERCNCSYFFNGFMIVKVTSPTGKSTVGFLDKNGNLALKTDFNIVSFYKDGVFYVNYTDENFKQVYGFINLKGKMILIKGESKF